MWKPVRLDICGLRRSENFQKKLEVEFANALSSCCARRVGRRAGLAARPRPIRTTWPRACGSIARRATARPAMGGPPMERRWTRRCPTANLRTTRLNRELL
jgi:hypothetical protein